MSRTILVTGATGRVGSELLRLLMKKGEQVRAATRNPARASSPIPVEFVAFDYDQPRTFAPALAGVERLFLVVRPGDNHSDRAAAPLVDAAKNAGVRHIVALTAMGVEQDDTFMLRILEKYIEASGVQYTHLRPNWFMQSLSSGPMFADIRATGALHLPAADARISFVDLRDVAAVGCAALTEPLHGGNAYTLTGAEPLSYDEVVKKISLVAGKTIAYVPLSEAAACESLAKAGIPAELIERWKEFHRKVRQGFCAPVTRDIERVLGRPPILFDRFATDAASSWRQPWPAQQAERG